MRHADVRNIRPPEQITESDDPNIKFWLGGFESMRNAVLALLGEEINPDWEFTAVYPKQRPPSWW